MWLHLTEQLILENLPLRRTCAGTTYKIAVAYLGRSHLVRGKESEYKTSIFDHAKFNELWFSWNQSYEIIASLTYLEIMQKRAWLLQHSLYQWNFSFFCPDFSTYLVAFTFKHASYSCYCYPCWRCTKLNPLMSLTVNKILPLFNNTLVTT